jgi:hypothetical protein
MKTVPTKKTHLFGAAFVTAAMSLNTVQSAYAEAAPERGVVAFKYLNYQDWQPDQDRIGVNAFSIMGMVPIAGEWSISTSYTYDSVSGASPAHHTWMGDAVSGASGSEETRHAGDLSITRYLSGGSVTAGTSYSSESDYVSRSYSLQGSLSSEDKNTTLTIGASYTNDTINPNNNVVEDEKKEIYAGLFGITRVLSKTDIMQVNFGLSKGEGYYDDPYKENDFRPDKRDIKTVMARWNHHFDGTDGTSRLSYRYYTDSFGIDAHTLGLEYVQPLSKGWTIIPSVRLHSQSAADFYLPVDPSSPDIAPFPANPGDFSTSDQRLSAFGALTLGVKVEKQIAEDWTFDVKFEHYEQRADWCVNGDGDPGLEPFNFRSIQVGISRKL